MMQRTVIFFMCPWYILVGYFLSKDVNNFKKFLQNTLICRLIASVSAPYQTKHLKGSRAFATERI